MAGRPRVIDGDGHVYEPDHELMKYFEGPHAIKKRNSAISIFPSLDGWPRGVMHEREDNNPNRPFHTDVHVWRNGLEKLGLEGAVLFPTGGLGLGLMRDRDFSTAAAVAYNNWLEDNYTAKDPRLYGAGLVPIKNPEAAVTEIDRCANRRKNFACMLMPTVTAPQVTYGDQMYWPIFEAAAQNDIPIAFHGGPAAGFGLSELEPFYMVHTLSHPVPLFLQLASIMFSGVLDAYPDLRLVFLEAGCSWVPFMMDRLDQEYEKIYSKKLRAKLKRRPSAYFRETENFWVSAELEEKGLAYTIDAIGSDRIIYASDYPHEPTEEELLSAVPEFLENPRFDDRIKEKILYHNAANLYRITEDGIARNGHSARTDR